MDTDAVRRAGPATVERRQWLYPHHPENEYAVNVVLAYTLFAPIYELSRPLWANWIMSQAEGYLEQEVLPRLLTAETLILDLGCGTGTNLARLRRLGLPFASYTGLDLTPAMLARAQAKLNGQTPAAYCRGDMRRLPFADQSFDLVLSTWALSHVPAPRPVFDEALRVLKSEGAFIALFWSRPAYPTGVVGRLLAPLLLMRFVELADLRRFLGKRAVIRRFASGWGASVLLGSQPPLAQTDSPAGYGRARDPRDVRGAGFPVD